MFDRLKTGGWQAPCSTRSYPGESIRESRGTHMRHDGKGGKTGRSTTGKEEQHGRVHGRALRGLTEGEEQGNGVHDRTVRVRDGTQQGYSKRGAAERDGTDWDWAIVQYTGRGEEKQGKTNIK